ncbi:Potassium channel SKOR [Glycine soja]
MNHYLNCFLAGIFGMGFLEAAYVDNGAVDVQESAKKERERIEELLRSRGIRYGSYPRFTVYVKGQKVSIKFQIPPNCEVSQLIANLTAHLGTKAEGHGGGSDMLLRAWDRLHEEFFLRGEVIMEQGNVVDQLYFVCHGVMKTIEGKRGKEKED